MADLLYCWRCNRTVPMLDDREWAAVEPLLHGMLAEIQRYRQDHQAPLAEALEQGFGHKALLKYRELTGLAESEPAVLWHHRSSLLGPACSSCGKPLRTPRATYCAACGAARV